MHCRIGKGCVCFLNKGQQSCCVSIQKLGDKWLKHILHLFIICVLFCIPYNGNFFFVIITFSLRLCARDIERLAEMTTNNIHYLLFAQSLRHYELYTVARMYKVSVKQSEWAIMLFVEETFSLRCFVLLGSVFGSFGNKVLAKSKFKPRISTFTDTFIIIRSTIKEL